MTISQEITELVAKLLQDALGKEEYENRIRAIADILNDLEYQEVELPADSIAKLVLEYLSKKTHHIYRSVWKTERNLDANVEWRYRVGKWMWKSTSDKIAMLSKIRDGRLKGTTWKDLSKELGIPHARLLVNNIRLGLVNSTEAERDIIKDIPIKKQIKSSKSRIPVLKQIQTLRQQQIPWAKIDKQLNISAYTLVFRVFKNLLKVTPDEQALAKEILND